MAPSLSRGSLLASIYNAVKGKTVRYATYPPLTGSGVAGVLFTTAAGGYSAVADVIPTKTITTDIWLTAIVPSGPNAAEIYEFVIGNAALAIIYANVFRDFVVTSAGLAINFPYPIFLNANQQVQAKVGGLASKTIKVALQYATLV